MILIILFIFQLVEMNQILFAEGSYYVLHHVNTLFFHYNGFHAQIGI
jgi:hypothetical protein